MTDSVAKRMPDDAYNGSLKQKDHGGVNLHNFLLVLICLVIACTGVDNFKLTGIKSQGGAFVYEAVLLLLISLLLIRRGSISRKRAHFVAAFLCYFIFLLLNFIGGFDMYYLVGNGSFRLQIESALFVLALSRFVFTRKDVSVVCYVIVVVATINAAASVMSICGLVRLPYATFARGSFFRYGGLSDYPAHMGLLAATSLAMLLCLRLKLAIKIPVAVLQVAGLVLSQSRSAFAALAVCLIWFLLQRRKIFIGVALAVLLIVVWFACGFENIVRAVPEETFSESGGRVSALANSVNIVSEHPLGISWESYEHYATGIPPHNLIAAVALYAGIPGLIAFILALYYAFQNGFLRWHMNTEQQSVIIGTLSLLIFSLFEQELQHSFFQFVLWTFAAVSTGWGYQNEQASQYILRFRNQQAGPN